MNRSKQNILFFVLVSVSRGQEFRYTPSTTAIGEKEVDVLFRSKIKGSFWFLGMSGSTFHSISGGDVG